MSDKIQEAMEKNQAKRKKEDKKYLIIMIILFIVSGGVGFLSGILIDKLKSGMEAFSISKDFMITATYAAPIILLVINIILLIIALVSVSKAKKALKKWDGEDEDAAEKMEGFVGLPLVMSTIVSVIDFFMFAVCVNLDINNEFSKELEKTLLICNVGIFIFALVIMVVVQKLCIDFTKDMNPEKKGSIYDAKFSDKWIDSCDEAQQIEIYKAGCAAYKVVSSMCMWLWIVCLIGDLFFGIGLLPVTIVFIIWLTGVIAYNVAAMKNTKKR